MPIYEYQCTACSHHLEELQKFSDPPLTVCPVCKKPKLQRLVSHTSFQLKGGGYYATDYKKKATPAETPKSEKTESNKSEPPKTKDKKADDAK